MPYFSQSLADEPFAIAAKRLAEDVATAEHRLRAISEDRASRPRAPGKWSPKQVLGHLIDSASNNHQRFVRAQLVEALRDPGYAQEGWVASQHYGERRWIDLVDLWCAYNRHLVHVIGRVPESRRDVPIRIGGDAPVTLGFVVLDYVGHIQHHLRQVFDAADA